MKWVALGISVTVAGLIAWMRRYVGFSIIILTVTFSVGYFKDDAVQLYREYSARQVEKENREFESYKEERRAEKEAREIEFAEIKKQTEEARLRILEEEKKIIEYQKKLTENNRLKILQEEARLAEIKKQTEEARLRLLEEERVKKQTLPSNGTAELARNIIKTSICGKEVEYPSAARRAEATGITSVEFAVDRSYNVILANVIRSAGNSREHKMLDRIALNRIDSGCFDWSTVSPGKYHQIDFVWRLE